MSDPESISSGRAFPKWIKPRSDIRTNIETVLSPPSHDDSFFFIRYPTSELIDNKSSNIKVINEVIHDFEKPVLDSGKSLMQNEMKQHTEPCKLYIDKANNSAAPSPAFSDVKNQRKPFGTDDGFKGPGAACGSSIVKVARQMVSSKSIGRGFSVVGFNKDIETKLDTADEDLKSDTNPIYLHTYHSLRRGSKSLPTSPLSSPRPVRKGQPNPYFTEQCTINSSSKSATSESNRSGFFSSLLGIQREANSTMSVVSNVSEEAEDLFDLLSKNPNNVNNPKLLQTKPSELREMNFWSPTSM